MSTTETSGRFTTLPDDQTLAATVVALEEHGFSVEVVDDLDAARQAVLTRIPRGSSIIFVAGAQKIVPTIEAARERIYQHSLKLEDARAQAAYGLHSYVGKILEIHQELPGRIHIVLIRQPAGY